MKEFIKALTNSNRAQARKLFNETMARKVSDKLELKKIEVASKIYDKASV